jgi:hypothetical protein
VVSYTFVGVKIELDIFLGNHDRLALSERCVELVGLLDDHSELIDKLQ